LTRQDNIFAFGRTGPQGQPIPGTDFVLRTLFGATTFTGADFENRVMALNQLPRATNEDRGLSVEMNYDFENTTLTSITAWRAFDTTDEIDADFSNVALFTKRNTSEQSSLSQELRLSGNFGERVSYVSGIYYFAQDLDADNTLTTGANFADFFIGDCLLFQLGGQQPGTEPSTDQGQLACLVDGIAAATAGVPGPPNGPGPLPPSGDAFIDGGFAREVMLQEHTSWAIFSQVDFELSDAWRLTVGLRYTDEEKELNGSYLQNALGTPPDLAAIGPEVALFLSNPQAYNPYTPSSLAAFGPLRESGWGAYLLDVTRPRPASNESLDDEQVSGTVKLSWYANDSMLFYASYGTGYKSGGTNTDRINAAFSSVFEAETSEAIEIGMKADFETARLNVAFHNTQIDDLQANSFTGLGFNLQNAGKADTHGAEVELWWAPLDAVNLQLAYTWTIAEFDAFANGTCWVATPFHTGQTDPGQSNPNVPVCDRSGDRLPSTPEHNVFLATNLFFPLTGSTNLFIRPEINYYSDIMTDGNNEPLKLKDAYQIYNLRVGLEFIDWDASVTLWGRNLADEADYETVFDVPIQDGKLNAYPREPRTWGLTFRKNFD
jgi:outer membrane receptor protein involved in Fe transport